MEHDTLAIEPIELMWSDWVPWDDLARGSRTAELAARPPSLPGVYEVREVGSDERLTIGRASNIRNRVQGALVRGTAPHSTGDRFRTEHELCTLEIRWAATDRPAAAEEELHRRYQERFGELPECVRST